MDELKKDIENCIQVLRSGGVILYPTDTIWGIGCDAGNAEAVNKIIQLKQRSSSKSMIILVAEIKEITNYTDSDISIVYPFIENQTKSTTIIYPDGKNVSKNVLAQDGSIGIRVIQDFFCQCLIKAFGSAIVSTSANISGELSPSCFQEIDEEIKMNVDYVVEYRQNDQSKNSASRIIRYELDGTLTMIRP